MFVNGGQVMFSQQFELDGNESVDTITSVNWRKLDQGFLTQYPVNIQRESPRKTRFLTGEHTRDSM